MGESKRQPQRGISRRDALRLTAGAIVAARGARLVRAAGAPVSGGRGAVCGEPYGEKVGREVLAGGGNAVDAMVAAALTAAVTSPHLTGPGGYAATIIIASADGRKIAAIDANMAAPGAARPDLFKPDDKGDIPGRANEVGWLAAGVPGILAGLQLALDRHGTRSFADSVQPAIRLARDGFAVSPALATAMHNMAPTFRTHEGGRQLFLAHGEPPAAGEIFRNPALADMLSTLAQRNSVESFYRGDIAQRIAEDFARHGGLVTAKDLAAYHAREVAPLQTRWEDAEVSTPPLTSGGFTILQCLNTLGALRWPGAVAGLERTHAYLEALRIAWSDRLAYLGDPQFDRIPQEKLLSATYAEASADRVRAMVKARTILSLRAEPRLQPGTINLSVVDRDGNMAAMTLTQGTLFGSGVTIDGLGLTLGNGMSRFEVRPGHPNSIAPGKRPLHNMTPTIVRRAGRPVLAIGGRGSRKIPNAVLTGLVQSLAFNASVETAIAAPRAHTEGTPLVDFEPTWPADELRALPSLGYQVKTSPSAIVSAVSFDPRSGEARAAIR